MIYSDGKEHFRTTKHISQLLSALSFVNSITFRLFEVIIRHSDLDCTFRINCTIVLFRLRHGCVSALFSARFHGYKVTFLFIDCFLF